MPYLFPLIAARVATPGLVSGRPMEPDLDDEESLSSLTDTRSSSPVLISGRPLEPYFGFLMVHHPDQDFDLDAYEPQVIDPHGYDASSENSEGGDDDDDDDDDDEECYVAESAADLDACEPQHALDTESYDASSESSEDSDHEDHATSTVRAPWADAWDALLLSKEWVGFSLDAFFLSERERGICTIDATAHIHWQVSDRDYLVQLDNATRAVHSLRRFPDDRYFRDINIKIYDTSSVWLLNHILGLKVTLSDWKADRREHFFGHMAGFALCLELQYHLLGWVYFFDKLKYTYMDIEDMVSPYAVRSLKRCALCRIDSGSGLEGNLKFSELCPLCGPPQKFEHLEEMKKLISALKYGVKLLYQARYAAEHLRKGYETQLRALSTQCTYGHLKLKQLYKWHCDDCEVDFVDYISLAEFWRCSTDKQSSSK